MRNGHPVGSRCSRGSYSMYRILSYPAVSYPIVSYRIGSYRIAVEHRVERPHARPPLLFHGKRKRGEDSTEPRRQSATGNLKSCANTEATRELDGSQGDPTAGGSGGGLVSRFPATKQRGSSKYTWKVTLAKLRSSVQFASEWLADDQSPLACQGLISSADTRAEDEESYSRFLSCSRPWQRRGWWPEIDVDYVGQFAKTRATTASRNKEINGEGSGVIRRRYTCEGWKWECYL